MSKIDNYVQLKSAKADGKIYLKVKPHLVRHLLRGSRTKTPGHIPPRQNPPDKNPQDKNPRTKAPRVKFLCFIFLKF